MWRAIMQLVVVGVLLTRATAADNNGIGHGNERKGFDLMCGLFTKAEKGAKEKSHLDKLKETEDYQWFNKDARDSPALKTEVDKVKELESKVQSYESGARTAFRKAAYGDNIETEDADKTFGSHGEHSPCDPTNRSSTIPKEIVCFCSSVGATDYCFVGVKAQNHDGSTAEQRSQAWNDLKSRCTGGSGSVEVTVDAIRKDLEGLRGLYPQEPIDDPPQPPPPPLPLPMPPPPPPPQKKRDPLASKPWVQRLNEATDHMKGRDEALQKLRDEVKKLKGTYGKAKNEEEVKALKESGAGAEGAQPSRTAPQTAARKDSDAEPTQTQKQNIASFPSLKITLLSVSLCFI